MFLHSEITAHSRVPNYITNNSVEHLSALINLYLLIERHKKLILARAEPGRSVGIEDSAVKYSKVEFTAAV